MYHSAISAADCDALDLFNLSPAFQGARRNGADKARAANDEEVMAYMRWIAERGGVATGQGIKAKLEYTEFQRGVESRCIGATFGGVFVAMPGADQNGAVECEILDSDGNVERAFTMRPKGGRGGKLECAKADEAALKAANKGKAKRAPKAAPAPVVDTAPPAPPLEEIENQSAPVALPATEAATIYDAPIGPDMPKIERVTMVQEIRGNIQYGSIVDHWFVVGLGHRFESCEGPRGRWYVQREGRVAAYGEGYAAKGEAIEAARVMASDFSAELRGGPILPAKTPESVESDLAVGCEADALNNALSARVAEIEARLAAMESAAPLSEKLDPDLGECLARAHAPVKRAAVAFDDRPRRLRIVRAYLAMRKRREAMRADYVEEHDRAIKIAQERNKAVESCQEAWKEVVAMEAQRDHAREHLLNALADKAALETELATVKAKRARTVTNARDNARKARAAMQEMAFNQMATENLLAVRCARIEHLERNMADPMMPERQSDIARLVQERDAARDERDAALAKAARIEMGTESLSAQIDAMALRLVRAEQALKRAGITPLAAVA